MLASFHPKVTGFRSQYVLQYLASDPRIESYWLLSRKLVVYFSFTLSALLLLLTLFPCHPSDARPPKRRLTGSSHSSVLPSKQQGFSFLSLCQCLCSQSLDIALRSLSFTCQWNSETALNFLKKLLQLEPHLVFILIHPQGRGVLIVFIRVNLFFISRLLEIIRVLWNQITDSLTKFSFNM